MCAKTKKCLVPNYSWGFVTQIDPFLIVTAVATVLISASVVTYVIRLFYRGKIRVLELKVQRLEARLQHREKQFYGETFHCGYCTWFGETTDCPRDERNFDAEPCELFEKK